MKKQSFLTLLIAGILVNFQASAQHDPPMPKGKCLLTVKAEVIRGQAVANPAEHTIIVDVSTSGFMGGQYLTIKTDNSKMDMTGQADLAPMGIAFKDLHFSLTGSPSFEFTSDSVGKMVKGEFRFAGTKDNGVYSDAHGTKGSFTLRLLEPTEQRPNPAALQEKAIYNSNEEWWIAFKNWMLGL